MPSGYLLARSIQAIQRGVAELLPALLPPEQQGALQLRGGIGRDDRLREQARSSHVDLSAERPGISLIELNARGDVPGADEKTVDITLEKNVLTIYAYPPVETVENYSLTYGEYGVGDFERKFSVPQDIDHDKIEAKVKNGVLTLHLPKAGPAKARKIEVRSV